MKKDPFIIVDQVDEERRKLFELVFIIFLLGLILNITGSWLYDFLQNKVAFPWIPIVISVVIVIAYFCFWILRPIKKRIEIPVVLFFDQMNKTISVPAQIHTPRSDHPADAQGIENLFPFPVTSRSYFDRYKKSEEYSTDDTENFDKLRLVIEAILQLEIINCYSRKFAISWDHMTSLSTGPFNFGYFLELPSEKIDPADLVKLTNNKILKLFSSGSLVLPQGTIVQSPSPNVIRFKNNKLFQVDFSVFLHGSITMDTWKYALGVTSSWSRKLSSKYSDTQAFLFVIHVNINIKYGLRYVVPEKCLPAFLKPKYSIRNIVNWMNDWISSLTYYFDWVDEDLSKVPDAEKADLIKETPITYRPRVKGAPDIRF